MLRVAMEKITNLALKIMDVCGWVAMAGFILFQLLCVVAPDIEVGNIYVNGLIGITLTSGVVFAIGLAAIAAALVVCSIIVFVYNTYHKK